MKQDTLNKITGGSFLTTPINESTIFFTRGLYR
jgi:hypothetical protein